MEILMSWKSLLPNWILTSPLHLRSATSQATTAGTSDWATWSESLVSSYTSKSSSGMFRNLASGSSGRSTSTMPSLVREDRKLMWHGTALSSPSFSLPYFTKALAGGGFSASRWRAAALAPSISATPAPRDATAATIPSLGPNRPPVRGYRLMTLSPFEAITKSGSFLTSDPGSGVRNPAMQTRAVKVPGVRATVPDPAE
mmetsp:Transcript_14361/g.36236  ORF Transcript_14361/g.36236 Transcript_14361/m.36236 type:complete len:200 (+) Transcript_14361:88-687(+)